jgi:hypothetical protein
MSATQPPSDKGHRVIYALNADGSIGARIEVVDGRMQLNNGKSIAVDDVFWLVAPSDPRIELAALNAETLENILGPLPHEVRIPKDVMCLVFQREVEQ